MDNHDPFCFMVQINSRRHAVLAQEAFDGLPASEQITIKRSDEIQARLINEAIRKKSQALIGNTQKIRVLEIPRSTTLQIIERSDYFEIGEMKVAKENLGKPTLPRGEIEINPKVVSLTKPQAWSRMFDRKLRWYYNYEGAKKEARHRGGRLPTIVELMHMLNSTTMTAAGVASVL